MRSRPPHGEPRERYAGGRGESRLPFGKNHSRTAARERRRPGIRRTPGVQPGGQRVSGTREFCAAGRGTGEPRCRTRSVTRLTRHGDISVCIVRFRARRGSQGCSCTPGWPGQATGGHQLRAGGYQLPDGTGRLCCGPPPHRGCHRDRAAGVRPRHGGRRGAQRSGRNGRTVRRDADGCAAAARDRGPFSIPGDA